MIFIEELLSNKFRIILNWKSFSKSYSEKFKYFLTHSISPAKDSQSNLKHISNEFINVMTAPFNNNIPPSICLQFAHST
jgi:hypothetical protein